MKKTITLIPAYGRDYKTADQVRADWADDRDFKIADTSSPYYDSYVNREDLARYAPGVAPKIRFKRLVEFVIIED